MSSSRGDFSNESSDDENPRKKRRISDKFEIEERLESLISRVGDKSTSSSLESNLEGLASVLEADLGNHKKKIFKIIINCAVDLPQRLCVYTTLVGLLNASNYSAGGDFIELLVTYFKDALRGNNYATAVHLMRFLSDLTTCRVVMPSSILNFYNTFLDAAYEENVPQMRSDWLVYAVLSCLPWSGKELSEKREVELDRLLASVESYIERRNRDFVPALLVWTNEEQEARDSLDSLWLQLQDMRQSNWREKMVRRPYTAFEATFRDALQHTISSITIPTYDPKLTPLPRVPFRIFDYSDLIEDVPRLPKVHSIERFIVEETINAVIHANYTERKLCADILLSIEFKEKVPLNYLIIEAIFGQLFQMSESPYIHLMYGVLLIELCKLQPSSMPQVLAQATMILYSKLDTMNISCVQRFAEWFAYHLSNFQFKWVWDDWNDSINMHLEAPKSIFVQETLKRCLRLSYHQRVTDIIPVSFKKLVPPDPQPTYKYQDPDCNVYGKDEAVKVIEALREKCSSDEMTKMLNIKDEVTGEIGNNAAKIDIFLQSLLFLASKTISHSFAAIAKYHPTLKSITEGKNKMESQQLQIFLLHSLNGLWINKPQMISVLVDKFLKTQLVSCSAVVNWIFSSEMSPWLTSFHTHEILESTGNKLKIQVQKEEREMVKKRSEKNSEDEMEEVDATVQLEKSIKELEGLQLSILEHLMRTLTEHINRCDVEGSPYKTFRFDYLRGRLLEFLLKCRSNNLMNELKSKFYETKLHISILKIFEMVQPLVV